MKKNKKNNQKKTKKIILIILGIIIIVILAFIIIGIVTKEKNPNYVRGLEVKNGKIIKYTGFAFKLKTPSNVTSIGSDSFASDMGYGIQLKTIEITGNVKTIDDSAFMFSTIQTIVMDEGVKEIEDYAFDNMYELKRIVFPRSVKKIPGIGTEEGRDHVLEYVCIKGSYACKHYYKNYIDFEGTQVKVVDSIEKYKIGN